MPPNNGRLEVDDATRVIAAVLTGIALAFVAVWTLVRRVPRVVRWVRRWGDLLACLGLAGVVAWWLSPYLGEWKLVPTWPAAPLPIVAAVMLAVTAVLFWLRCPLPAVQTWFDRKAEARLRRREAFAWHEAARAAGLEGTKVKDVASLDGVVTARVEIPAGLPGGMPALLHARDTLAGGYPDDRRYGPIERLFLNPCEVNASRHAYLTVIRTPLQLPPPLEEVLPARGSAYRLGRGFRGDVYWDLNDDPHASVNGPTRSGKGNLLRYIALQALEAGQHVDVLDGTGSHEWAPLLGYGGLFRWRPYEENDLAFYTWAAGVLDDFGADMVARNREIGQRGFDNFGHMLNAQRAGGMTRRLLLVDEASTTLRSASPDKRVAGLVASVAGKVDAVAKTAAKAGGHLVAADQLPYQGQVGLAPATRAQLGRWVVTGPVPDEMRPAVSGLRSWSFETPEGRGFAATGRRGHSAEMLVIPEVGRNAVRNWNLPDCRTCRTLGVRCSAHA